LQKLNARENVKESEWKMEIIGWREGEGRHNDCARSILCSRRYSTAKK